MTKTRKVGSKELHAIESMRGGTFTILVLLIGAILIYEYQSNPEQLLFIEILYGVLSLWAWDFTHVQHNDTSKPHKN